MSDTSRRVLANLARYGAAAIALAKEVEALEAERTRWPEVHDWSAGDEHILTEERLIVACRRASAASRAGGKAPLDALAEELLAGWLPLPSPPEVTP